MELCSDVNKIELAASTGPILDVLFSENCLISLEDCDRCVTQTNFTNLTLGEMSDLTRPCADSQNHVAFALLNVYVYRCVVS